MWDISGSRKVSNENSTVYNFFYEEIYVLQ